MDASRLSAELPPAYQWLFFTKVPYAIITDVGSVIAVNPAWQNLFAPFFSLAPGQNIWPDRVSFPAEIYQKWQEALIDHQAFEMLLPAQVPEELPWSIEVEAIPISLAPEETATRHYTLRATLHHAQVADTRDQAQAATIDREISQAILNSQEGLFVLKTDVMGQYTYANPQYCKRFGLDEAAIMGRNSIMHILPEDHAKCAETVVACLEAPGRPHTVILRKPCPEAPGYLTTKWEFTMMQDQEGLPSEFVCLGIDISPVVRTRSDYDFLLEHISDTVVSLDLSGAILYASPNWYRSYGYQEVDTIGKPFQAFVSPAARRHILRAGKLSQQENRAIPVTHQVICGAGKLAWVETKITFVAEIGQFVAILRDVSAQYETQEALRQNEAMMEAAGEIAEIGGWSFFPQTGDIRWTPQTYHLFEIPSDYPLYLPDVLKFYTPASRELLEVCLDRALQYGEGSDIEVDIITATGKKVVARVIGRPTVEDGITIKLEGVIQNIGPQKEIESKLRRHGDMLNHTQEIAKLGGWELDLATGLTIWTDEVYRIHGVSKDFDHNKANGIEFYHPDDRPIIIKAIEAAIATHESFDVECRFITAQQEHKWVRVIGSPALHQGKASHIKGLFQDITEPKEAELTLQMNEAKLRHLTDNMQEIFWLLSADLQQILYVNAAYEKMYNRSVEQLYENPHLFWASIHPEEVGKVQAGLAAYQKTGQFEQEIKVLNSDGETRWIWAKQKAVRDDSGQIISHTGIATDITDRKADQERIHLLQSVVENAHDAVLITKAEPIDATAGGPEIIYANPAFYKMTGYSPEEVIGQTPRILQGPNSSRAELDRLRKKLENWESAEVEVINVKKDGSEFWSQFIVSPVADANGWYTHWVSIQRDVTERKESEIELLHAKEDAEKASQAKSEFLSTMSHEIRTPLNAVIGMTGVLSDTKLDHDQQDLLRTIRKGGENLLSVINDVLDYAKIESGKMDLEVFPFAPFEPIDDTFDLLANKAHKKGLELITLPDATVPHLVEGDLARIRQVLVNLVGNAIKFTPSGEIVVSVQQIDQIGDICQLQYTVEDTGPGIPAAKIHRLFKSFSQVDASITRKHGGTGLGLAISQKLVELHGGRIWIESKASAGAIFHFTVQTRRQAPAQTEVLPLVNTHIWLIEAHPLQRQAYSQMLQQAGARVHSGEYPADMPADGRPDVLVWAGTAPTLADVAACEKLQRDHHIPHMVLARSQQTFDLSPTQSQWSIQVSKPLMHTTFVKRIEELIKTPISAHKPGLLQAEKVLVLKGKKILLVEDNKINQKVATRMLQKFEVHVEVANNGQEAVDYVQLSAFDLILMDMQMPVMDGLAATEAIRKLNLPQQPTIIAMTANAGAADRERCLAAGMNDFLSKPVKLDALRSFLQKWMAPSHADANSLNQPLP